MQVERIMQDIQKNPPVPPSKEEYMQLMEKATELLIKEKNVIEIQSPVTLVGDIHGQIHDMLEIFKIEPPAPESKYLFLGDYVDRGGFSVEVMAYLMCLKIKYPDRVWMIRGNHETGAVCSLYGYQSECMQKYNDPFVFQRSLEFFNFLPIAALIDKRIFGVHGGLSPSVHLLEQVEAINRFQEPPTKGGFSDLLWADPDEGIAGFQISARGAGYIFGRDVTQRFAYLNRLVHLTRAHQLAFNGYQMWFNGLMSTVWSAPNYQYSQNNLASVLRLSQESGECKLFFNVFDAVPENERSPPPGPYIPSYFA